MVSDVLKKAIQARDEQIMVASLMVVQVLSWKNNVIAHYWHCALYDPWCRICGCNYPQYFLAASVLVAKSFVGGLRAKSIDVFTLHL